MVCSLLKPFDLSLAPQKPSNHSSLRGPFSPFKGCLLLVILTDLFSLRLCAMIFIMLRTILPRIFKFIYFHLIGFWELWLFNYPLAFTLSFPTINPMDWHDTKGIPSIRVSRTYDQYFSSIWWGNPMLLAFQCRYRIWALMGVRVHGTILTIVYSLSNQYLSDLWPTLHLFTFILTPNFDPWSLICAISIWRMKGELGWERKNIIFSTKMDLTTF